MLSDFYKRERDKSLGLGVNTDVGLMPNFSIQKRY